MYSKQKNHVTFFKDGFKENTDKVIYGRITEAIKVGKDSDGKDVFEFQNWSGRFTGKAYEKAKSLQDKTAITLTEWAVYCPYSKEHKKVYPYIMVIDFEMRDNNQETKSETTKSEPKKNSFDNFKGRDYDMSDLERMLLEASMPGYED